MSTATDKLNLPFGNTGVVSDIFRSLSPVFEFFSDYPISIFFAVVIFSFIFTKIVTSILTTLIMQFTRRTKVHWDDQIIGFLSRPVFWTLFLLGVFIAVIPLELSKSSLEIMESSIATVLILLWSGFVLKLTILILKVISLNADNHSIIRVQTKPLFQNLAYILVFGITIYLVFISWHIDMTAWLASAGIMGIAIGFAAKDTLANLFAGVFILADSPYKIGDYVVLDSGERGKVTHIGIRSTRLLTRGDVEITIPNAVMGNTRISNESGGPHEKYRLRVKVGVAYGSNIDHVKELLMAIALNEKDVCDSPEPRVRFRTFGGSSLDIELLCWVETPEVRGRVLDILNTAIYKCFNDEGIEIPYSKQDLYIKEMPNSTEI